LLLSLAFAQGQQTHPTLGLDGESIDRRPITIPMAEAGPAGLEGLLIVPRTRAKPPLILILDGEHFSHLNQVKPEAFLPEALWFAREGWAVAIILRRGVGLSGGEESDHRLQKMKWSDATFEWLEQTNAQDLRAAYAYLATQPDVDATRTVAAGYFFAGLAGVWLADGSNAPPPGLKAVINFDGGYRTVPDWGKQKVHEIPDALLPSFAKLGESTKTPMLWLYSDEASAFRMDTAYAAFTAAGGVAEMHMLPHAGNDDPRLFGEDVSEWAPIVEHFLERLNLPAGDTVDFANKQLPKDGPDEVRADHHRLAAAD
jgi:dienelactone hydrolase